MGADMKDYESHPGKSGVRGTGKPLIEHTRGVIAGARRRTHFMQAEIAALFHDLGKINPNFQRKLYEKNVSGYSAHAYLSAFAWLCFCAHNRELLQEWGVDDYASCVAITAMIAHHHGDLPNLGTIESRIFKSGANADPTAQLKKFLDTSAEKDLPLSDFLQRIKPHRAFSVFQDKQLREKFLQISLYAKEIPEPLDFFINTQFGFASLLEADKRDAGYNTRFNRKLYGAKLKDVFSVRLDDFQSALQKKSSGTNDKRRALDDLRTEMRNCATENLRRELMANDELAPDERRRVFTLPAPTGAGKTLMLLRLANEIIWHDARTSERPLSVIYALPFLSITEQTEAICRRVLASVEDETVLRVDSKAENKRLERAQEKLDSAPNEDNQREVLSEDFSQHTFDYPFIITTFVQVFETLVSNRNAALLRLPNFARSIFLLDEIQALPPRLYTFFAAYLDEFCRQFDSYAVISTATMPYLEMPPDEKYEKDWHRPRRLFKRYAKPPELLDASFYERKEFNRYRITRLMKENFAIQDLADEIQKQNKSCLVVLNTIADTRQLYEKLKEELSDDFGCVLLNTHFTPRDRRKKIRFCRQRLRRKENVILISTQLIEAGVDIDFPVLFRDMCPLPSLIQAAGRCNRNGSSPEGEVFLFELKKENGKSSAKLIYGDDPAWFFASRYISSEPVFENQLFEKQKIFFEDVGNQLQIGVHKQFGREINMIECINRARFADIGSFKLIDEREFGEELRYYIRRNENDDSFATLIELYRNRPRKHDLEVGQDYFQVNKNHRLAVDNQLRSMANRVVAFRWSEDKYKPVAESLGKEFPDDEVFGLRLLANERDYTFDLGIDLVGDVFI